MWIVGFLQIWNSGFAGKKSTAYIYSMHQFPPFPFRLKCICEANSTGIIYQYIDAAESFSSCFYCMVDAFFKTNIGLQWQYLTRTNLIYFFCGCKNSTV